MPASQAVSPGTDRSGGSDRPSGSREALLCHTHPGYKSTSTCVCRNQACKRSDSNPFWGMCLPQQRRQLRTYLQQQVQEGAVDASILSLSPCDMYELLAQGGRTLWLIG